MTIPRPPSTDGGRLAPGEDEWLAGTRLSARRGAHVPLSGRLAAQGQGRGRWRLLREFPHPLAAGMGDDAGTPGVRPVCRVLCHFMLLSDEYLNILSGVNIVRLLAS